MLVAVCIFLNPSVTLSQSTKSIGKITYYEGNIKIIRGGEVIKPKLKMELISGDKLVSEAESMVEVLWKNSKTTILGASSNSDVQTLFLYSNKNLKEKAYSPLDRFKSVFKKEMTLIKQQEGGIRRDVFNTDTIVTFAEAYSFFDAEDFLKAFNLFSTFINQHPQDENVKMAFFAKGHCLIELNNPAEAKTVFTDFIIKYPKDDLSKTAKEILGKLQ
jgi:hypothetical protein